MRNIIISLIGTLFSLALPVCGAEISIGDLARQIEGQTCVYSYSDYVYQGKLMDSCSDINGKDPAYQLPISKSYIRHAKFYCVLEAVECLRIHGQKAKFMVPKLLELLKDGPNDINTGDGALPYRSAIVGTLGRIGDESVVETILKVLQSDEPEYSFSGTFPPGYELEKGPAQKAALDALRDLGPKAKIAVPTLKAFLKKSADPEKKEKARAALKAIEQAGGAK